MAESWTRKRKFFIELDKELPAKSVAFSILQQSYKKDHEVSGLHSFHEKIHHYNYNPILWPFLSHMRRHRYVVLDNMGFLNQSPVYVIFELLSKEEISRSYKVVTARKEITRDIVKRAASALDGYSPRIKL